MSELGAWLLYIALGLFIFCAGMWFAISLATIADEEKFPTPKPPEPKNRPRVVRRHR